jgi:hypothetical protein
MSEQKRQTRRPRVLSVEEDAALTRDAEDFVRKCLRRFGQEADDATVSRAARRARQACEIKP